MHRQYHICYLMMQPGEIYRNPVELHELKRQLPIPDGRVRVYFAMWPEYRKRSLIRKKYKEWKSPELQAEMEKFRQKVGSSYDCLEILYEEAFQNKAWPVAGQELPLCVLQAWLHAQRPFDTVYLPNEWNQGMYDMQVLIELLTPYLPRLKRVIWTGEEGSASENLRNYLYEEYGMILLSDRKPPEGAVGIRRAQAWKFLDATVKNGYNTLVHCGRGAHEQIGSSTQDKTKI